MAKKLKLFASVAVSAGILVAPMSVGARAAAYDDCTCVTAPKAGAPALGSVSKPGSGVQMSGANGFVAATDGAAVGDGTELTVGADGGGSVSVGDKCKVSLKSFRLVSVSMPEGAGGKICVKVADLTPKAGAPGGAAAGGAAPTFTPVMIGLGAAVAGGLAILAFGGGGSPASP